MFAPMAKLKKSKVFLLLGSNLGDRLHHLSQAKDEIAHHVGDIQTFSSIYKTAPWGDSDQPEFFNQVLLVLTTHPPELVLEKILMIETRMGRLRKKKWGPRVIDIDILFYDQLIVNTENLTIPHPSLQTRRFTLVPLVEIHPELQHPILKKNVRTLLHECPDNLEVSKV
jgi:2-amino-4-hydroxy-6-hydroxymethyldihydropteridine diphosphokinase